MNEPPLTERDLIEQLADSFITKFRAGQRPHLEAYVKQYPELANDLRDLITALLVLEQNAPHRQRLAMPLATSQSAYQTPREIGEFTIVREIGRGGMGVVYEAVQQSLGRHVALKVLSSPGLLNPVHLERFRFEARSAGRLQHSHIVPVFGVGEHDGLHYYVMQYIAGQSLDQVIDALRKLRLAHEPTAVSGDERQRDPSASDESSATPEAQDDSNAIAVAAGQTSIAELFLSGQFSSAKDPTQAISGEISAAPAAPPSDPPATSRPGSNTATSSITAGISTRNDFTSHSSTQPFYEGVARVGLQVAEALSYAHAEGILHRDIKPSNLLLDAKGNAWITDFGLAKGEETVGLTQTGDFVGTLRYMSPERLDGWSDRRSDIYSLGATLYELLTLQTLWSTSSRSKLIEDIIHQQPVPPSKIDRSIPRDLETIVLKALTKEPTFRYHTAEAMADDLRRFLSDRPILARRSTATERFSRWCRHNPAVASLAACMIAVLLGATIVSTYFAVEASHKAAAAAVQTSIATRTAQEERRQRVRAEDAEGKAQVERKRAEVQTAMANEVSDFLTGLIQGADPIGLTGYGLGQTEAVDVNTTALDLLERGALKLQTELTNQPEVQARLMQSIGDVYTTFFKFDAAKPLLERSLELRRQCFGNKHQQVADSLQSLAVFHYMQGDLEGAENLCREALALRIELLGKDHLDVANSQMALGWVVEFGSGGRALEAEQLMKEALVTREKHLGATNRDVLVSQLALALILTKNYQSKEAAKELTSATAALEAGTGDKRGFLALKAYMQALIAQQTGNMSQAGEHFRECLDQVADLFGPAHPITSYLRSELTDSLFVGRDNALAEAMYREAIESNLAILGRRPFVAKSMEHLAKFLCAHGKDEEGKALLLEARDIQIANLGPQSASVAMTNWHLAEYYLAHDDMQRAYEHVRQAFYVLAASNRAIHGIDTNNCAKRTLWLALHHDDPQLYREACRVLLEARPSSEPDWNADISAWGCCLCPNSVTNPEALIALAQRAVDFDPNNSWYQRALGAALFRNGRYAEAEQVLWKGIQLHEHGGDPMSWLFSAMLHKHVGNEAKMRYFLDTIAPYVEDQLPELKGLRVISPEQAAKEAAAFDSNATPTERYGWDWLAELRHLYLEAAELIDGPALKAQAEAQQEKQTQTQDQGQASAQP